MLKTRCIYTSPEQADGLRISIMSRHTLNDGHIPDPSITTKLYTLWIPALAPPATLLGDYYKRGMQWPDFETRYLDHLATGKTKEEIISIIEAALAQDLTFLCREKNPEHCHRRLFAEHCKKLQPDLATLVR